MAQIVTAKLLRERGADAKCQEVERFERLFPEGVSPTVALAEVHYNDFSFVKAAELLLTSAQYEVFAGLKQLADAAFFLSQQEAADMRAWAQARARAFVASYCATEKGLVE